jgi:hypothetical protein
MLRTIERRRGQVQCPNFNENGVTEVAHVDLSLFACPCVLFARPDGGTDICLLKSVSLSFVLDPRPLSTNRPSEARRDERWQSSDFLIPHLSRTRTIGRWMIRQGHDPLGTGQMLRICPFHLEMESTG